jgi:hypothetical protein
VAFEMNKTFAKAMSDKVDHYNKQGSDLEAGAEVRGAEKIQKVRGEIEEVKQVMTENIDRILERGDKIELLVDKSSHLQEQVWPLEVRVCSRACDVSGFFSGVGVFSAFSLSIALSLSSASASISVFLRLECDTCARTGIKVQEVEHTVEACHVVQQYAVPGVCVRACVCVCEPCVPFCKCETCLVSLASFVTARQFFVSGLRLMRGGVSYGLMAGVHHHFCDCPGPYRRPTCHQVFWPVLDCIVPVFSRLSSFDASAFCVAARPRGC